MILSKLLKKIKKQHMPACLLFHKKTNDEERTLLQVH